MCDSIHSMEISMPMRKLFQIPQSFCDFLRSISLSPENKTYSVVATISADSSTCFTTYHMGTVAAICSFSSDEPTSANLNLTFQDVGPPLIHGYFGGPSLVRCRSLWSGNLCQRACLRRLLFHLSPRPTSCCYETSVPIVYSALRQYCTRSISQHTHECGDRWSR